MSLLSPRTFSLYRRSRRGVRVCPRRFSSPRWYAKDFCHLVSYFHAYENFVEISAFGFFFFRNSESSSQGGGKESERKEKWKERTLDSRRSCNSFRNYGNFEITVYLDSFPSDARATAFNVHINFAHATICMRSWPSLSLHRAVINCCLLTAFTRTLRNAFVTFAKNELLHAIVFDIFSFSRIQIIANFSISFWPDRAYCLLRIFMQVFIFLRR